MGASVDIAGESSGWRLSNLNNNPKIPARLFLNAVENLKECPRVVRSDCGKENVLIAGIQSYFRAHGNDEYAAVKAHQYGSSPSNQRIESLWSFF